MDNSVNHIVASTLVDILRLCCICHQERPTTDFADRPGKATKQCKTCIAKRRRRDYHSNWRRRAYHLYTSARQRAQSRGLKFSITPEWVKEQLSEGICARTGIPFDLSEPKGSKSRRNPFAPSIDRVDSRHGYSPDNVEMVCLIYNVSKRAWSKEDMLIMAKALVLKAAGIPIFTKVNAEKSISGMIEDHGEPEVTNQTSLTHKECQRIEAPATDFLAKLPELRRRIIIEDFDFDNVLRHEIKLYRSNRIDCYRVEIDDKTIPGRKGWARILELIRKLFIRANDD